MVMKGAPTKAGAQTRGAILHATLRLLGRDGPDAFSAATLAKAAGVSKATIFHHFGSLDEIAVAAFEQLWLQSLALDTRERMSARDYLDDLGREVIELAQKRREFLRAQVVFLTKAIFDSRLSRRISASAAQMHRVMVEELKARLPKSVAASEIDAMARMAEMVLDGLMIALVMRGSSKERTESKQAWARFVDLLLADVETR